MTSSRRFKIWLTTEKRPTNEVKDDSWVPHPQFVIDYVNAAIREVDTRDGWIVTEALISGDPEPIMIDQDPEKTIRHIVGEALGEPVPDRLDTVLAVRELADSYVAMRKRYLKEAQDRRAMQTLREWVSE